MSELDKTILSKKYPKLIRCPLTGVLIPVNSEKEEKWALIPGLIGLIVCFFLFVGGVIFLLMAFWEKAFPE